MKHARSSFFLLFALLFCFFSPANGQTNLGTVSVGKSRTAAVTVTFPAAATLSSVAVLTRGSANLDFTQAKGGSCVIGAAYAAAATCTIEVGFTPKLPGLRSGAIVLSGHSGPVATAALIGTGAGPQAVLLSGLLPPTLPTAVNTPVPPIFGVAVDGNGNAYVANPAQNSVDIYQWQTNYLYYDQMGTVGTSLSSPSAVAVDAAGNLDIADTGNGRIVQEVLSSGAYVQTTIASGFKSPVALAIDSRGSLYVADQQAGIVYKEHPNKATFTQTTLITGLNSPTGLAVDARGNLYIADAGTTLLKETLVSGKYQQSTIASNFLNLVSVAADPAGDLYLTTSTPTGNRFQDNTVGSIYIEVPSGQDYTLKQIGYSSGIDNSGFSASGIALDPSGNITVLDQTGEYPSGYYLQLDYLPAIPKAYAFAGTLYGVPSSDSPQTYVLVNYGNEPLKIGAIGYPVDFPEKAGVASDCASNSSLAAFGLCTLTIEFVPDSMISDCPNGFCQESVTIDSNSLNVSGAQQTIALKGTQLAPTATVTITSSARSITSVFPITYTVQVAGVTGFPAPTGNLNITDSMGQNNIVKIDSKGQYSFTAQSLPVGPYTVTAYYEGDTYYGNGATATYTQLVIGNTGATSNSPVGLGYVDVSSSKSGTITFSFTKSEKLKSIHVLTQGVANLEYTNSGSGTCIVGKTYAAKSSCTVGVLFKPRHSGAVNGAVVLTGSNGYSIGTAYLNGFGAAPALNLISSFPQNIYATATFNPPSGAVTDGAGNLDFFNGGSLDQLTPSNGKYQLTTLNIAGSGSVASGIPAMDGAGNVYVAAGRVYVGNIAGSGGGPGWTLFSNCCLHANAIAVDAHGVVYILDAGGKTVGDNPITYPPAIYKETPSNGSYVQSVIPGKWAAYPLSLAIDPSGNLYLSDYGTYNYTAGTGSGIVYKYAPQADGSYLQTLVDAGNWYEPESVAVDRVGNLYIADDQFYWGPSGEEGPLYAYWFLMEETPQSNGTYIRQRLAQDTDSIGALALDPSQDIFLGHQSDFVNNNDWSSMMLLGRTPNAAVTFAQTARGTISPSGIQTLTLQNTGNSTASISSITYPADFPHASGVKTDCSVNQKIGPNQSCTLSIQFAPVASLGSSSSAELSEVVTVKATAAGAFTSTNQINVSGLELKP